MWTPADVNRINQALGLTGRIEREQWIEQAQILAKGGETYYSRNRAALQAAPQPQPAPQVPLHRRHPAPARGARRQPPSSRPSTRRRRRKPQRRCDAQPPSSSPLRARVKHRLPGTMAKA